MMSKKITSARLVSRIALIAMLLLIVAGSRMLLHAQEPASPPAQRQDQNNSEQKQRGLSQELTHETREAAGEEKDDTAEFKRSPSLRLISKWTGLSLPIAYRISELINFGVIAAVVFWAARKNLPGIFGARTAAIQKAMQDAQKASEEARRRLADIESRLMKLDVEIGMMRDAAEKDAAAEEARIQAAGHEDARKIVETAQQEIAAAAKTARRELTAYAADLAIGLAQKQIRVDAATDQALVRNFAGELGSPETSGLGKARG
jgi:F-type H+-transporting ATPase subunit b